MIPPTASHYKVVPVALPYGYTIAEGQAPSSRLPTQFAPSSTIVSNNGTEYAILVSLSAGANSRLRVLTGPLRAKSSLVPWITDAEFGNQPYKAAGPVLPSGMMTYPKLAVSAIYLSDQASVYATFDNPFDAAYSGLDRWSFVYDHGAWKSASPLIDSSQRNNIAITAIQGPSEVAYAEDYERSPSFVSSEAQQGLEQTDEGWVVDGGLPTAIGAGRVTAIRKRNFVGFISRYLPADPMRSTKISAFLWSRGHLKRLGSGIAWSVNSAAKVVGDDRSSKGSSGKPVVWVNGKAHELSNSLGSAFSINDHDTIVGDVSTGAFIANADTSKSFQGLDNLLDSPAPGLHVDHAYRIADDGRILASTRSRSGKETVVVLEPER